MNEKKPINAKVGAGVMAGAVGYMMLRIASGIGFVATPEDASMLTIILMGIAGYYKLD